MQHEIGHLKNHSLVSSSNTKEGRDAILDSMAKTQSNVMEGNSNSKKVYKDMLKDVIPDKSKEASTKKELTRKENLEKYKKYESDSLHADRSEYEADAYASQHKNGEHLKRAVRDYYKQTKSKKNIDKQIKATAAAIGVDTGDLGIDKKEFKKQQNIAAAKNMKQRNKAAKDKTIDRSVYRESVDIGSMISESIRFLD